MRLVYLERLARFGIGALVLLLAQGFCAPGTAWAGCGHLVTSESDIARQRSLLSPLLDDLAGRSDGNSMPQPARTCSGAFCSGQPATPAVPAGTFDRPVDSWAWCASDLGISSGSCSIVFAESSAAHPIISVRVIFHPPRLVPCFV
jgi:hypothetical protein